MRKLYTIETAIGDCIVDYDKEEDKFYYLKAKKQRWIFVMANIEFEQTDIEITKPSLRKILKSLDL